jgi:molybdopterin-guanine dinucleotide biosynthesis protein A
VYLCHDQLVPRSTVSAAIVAGGQAKRLSGQDKSRLVVDGRPIIVRQLDVLQSIAAPVFVVGGLPNRYADLGLTVYPDVLPGAGALGGIYTAMSRAPTPLVIVVACDLPFLHDGLLRRLVTLSDARDGAWVETDRGVEPLVACYRSASAPTLRMRIESGQLRAADLGHVLDLGRIGPDELAAFGPPERLLANVNTPQDYARVQYGLS